MRITRELFEREHERLLHQPMDDQLVLRGIDVRNAAVADREMERVRRDDPLQLMMRGARARIARHVVGIVDRADDILFEAGWHAIGRNDVAGFEAPGTVFERLGPGARHAGGTGCRRAGKDGSAAEQGSSMQQAVPGHRNQIPRRIALERHDVPPFGLM